MEAARWRIPAKFNSSPLAKWWEVGRRSGFLLGAPNGNFSGAFAAKSNFVLLDSIPLELFCVLIQLTGG